MFFEVGFYSTCLPSGHLVDGSPLVVISRFGFLRAYMCTLSRKLDYEALVNCEIDVPIVKKLLFIVKFNMVELSNEMIIKIIDFIPVSCLKNIIFFVRYFTSIPTYIVFRYSNCF